MTDDGGTRVVQLPSGERLLPPVPGTVREPLGQPAPRRRTRRCRAWPWWSAPGR